MPFVPQQPRPYNQADVLSLNPNQNGVYGLLRIAAPGQGTWIYVGKGDIRQRLLDHLNNDNPSITIFSPTHWVAEVIPGDPSSREVQLTLELRPSCNRRVG